MCDSGRPGDCVPSPSEHSRLFRQLEDGTYLGSCDWGHCNRDQAGWGFSRSDAAEEWMAICAECAVGNFQPTNDEPYPVDGFVTFDDIWAAGPRGGAVKAEPVDQDPSSSSGGGQ